MMNNTISPMDVDCMSDRAERSVAPSPRLPCPSSSGGIHNVGNTCYLNSTLQALAHCTCFMDFILSCNPKQHMNITNSLKNLYQEIWEKQICARPLDLLRQLETKIDIMNLRQQNDALEFFTLLIDKINSEVGTPLERRKNPFNNRVGSHKQLLELANIDWNNANSDYYHPTFSDMFYGQNIVQVKCAGCGMNEHRGEVFASIDASFSCSNTSDAPNIVEMISNAYACETLTRSKCDICHAQNVLCTKSARVLRAPKILPVHLKRFDTQGNKIRKHVTIPQLISLDNICLSDEPTKYKLRATVCHVGSTQGGHYYAYCFNSRNNTWSLIDDDCVFKDIDPANVDTSTVYALFYERM